MLTFRLSNSHSQLCNNAKMIIIKADNTPAFSTGENLRDNRNLIDSYLFDFTD